MKKSLAGLVLITLAVGDTPPAEFRVFGPGQNSTRKGTIVFDADAAKSVMDAYSTHGVDLMIDLEHLSLDDESRNFDPDARGWAKLEVRTTPKGPELWATDVRWTPDGESRLTEKRQRYISPAMRVDPKSRRVLELVNIAICAMPATDKLTPLVAARLTAAAEGKNMVNPKLLAALGLDESATDDDVAKAMADAMKDPAKMAAMLSAAFDADDAEDASAKGDKDGEEEDEEAMADKPGAPAPAAKPGAPAPGAAPVKKVTTEYHAHKRGDVSSDLAAEVMSLRQQLNSNTVRDIILANRRKFTPALESWALKTYSNDPSGLESWLKAQPVLASAAHSEKKPNGSAEMVRLTAADVELCRQLNRDPKTFLQHKRELAAKGNPDALTALIDEEN